MTTDQDTCDCGMPWPCFCGATKTYVKPDTVLGTDAARNSDEQRSVTKLDPASSFVTITISREAAKKVADWSDDERYPFSAELGKAARAALEEEQ